MNESRVIALYEDLVDDTLDREMASLIMELDQYYAAPVIEAARRHAMRETVIDRHRQLRRLHYPQRSVGKPRSIAWSVSSVVTIVLVLALVAGSALAIAPRLRHVLNMDSGARHAWTSHLGVEVGASQSVGPYTVTIEHAYADANRVILGYRVDGPARPAFNALTNATLSDADGNVLPQRGGLGSGDGVSQGEYLEWFDASGIPGNPDTITLSFRADGIRLIDVLTPISSDDATEPAGQPSPASGSMVVDQIPANGVSGASVYTTISQPMSFEFTLPFEPSRDAMLHLADDRGRTGMMLERISVSPSETRLYLRGAGATNAAVQLHVGDWDSMGRSDTTVTSWTTKDGLAAISFAASLIDEHGTWRVVVTPGGSSANQHEFTFTVP